MNLSDLQPRSDYKARENQTVTSRIYAQLRDQIMYMQLVPGTSMSEQEMAQLFGVSRTPVREAFIRLSREKMVVVSPQRRTVIPKINIDRANQERFLRESLEYAVLEQLIPIQTPEIIRQLRHQIHIQEQSIKNGDYAAFLQHDDEYHDIYYTATNNFLCSQVLRRNVFDYQRLRYLSLNSEENISAANMEEHKKMVDLIVSRDLKAVQSLLRKHLRRIFDEIQTLKKIYPDYIL